MGTPSIFNQVKTALETVRLEEDAQKSLKARTGVQSLKRSLRPGGRPNRTLPFILGKRTFSCYLETGTKFFERARAVSGHRLLADLFTPQILTQTLDTHYRDMSPATHRTVLAALGMIHQGCRRRRWVRGSSPITGELRLHVRSYRVDGGVRVPRFGYRPEDCPRIIAYLQQEMPEFLLPAELALDCGLRLSEVAGLRGADLDLDGLSICVKGKGGRVRWVAMTAELAGRINSSKEYLFTPSRPWKSAFYRAVRKAARALDIKVSGVHRLRSNFAQEKYTQLRRRGKSDRDARQEVSTALGHNRIDVVKGYIP